jgi:hypothetical protein
MKLFLPFYLFLLLGGTVAVDLLVTPPANADGTPPVSTNGVDPGGAPVVETPAQEPAPPAAKPRPNPAAAAPAQPPAVTIIERHVEPPPRPGSHLKLPPLPNDLRSSGRRQAWGVTQTRVATSEGDLYGGTFLEYPDIQAFPLHAWYFADKKWNGPVVVPSDKVVFFGGALDDADPQDLRILQRYYFLRGRLEFPPEKGKAEEPANPNPFFEEYKELYKKSLDLQERSKTLTAQYNTAKGNDRIKIGDELRVIRQGQATLAPKLKAVDAKYTDWKVKNPNPQPAAPKTGAAADEDAELRAELRELEPEIKRLVN